jgi:hypothetical protein
VEWHLHNLTSSGKEVHGTLQPSSSMPSWIISGTSCPQPPLHDLPPEFQSQFGRAKSQPSTGNGPTAAEVGSQVVSPASKAVDRAPRKSTCSTYVSAAATTINSR